MKIDFQRGDIVRTIRGLAVIIDVLESRESNNVCLYVRFVGNIGNSRKYDMLELTPQLNLGVEQWERGTMEDLLEAVEKRRNSLEQELQEVITLAQQPVTT